MKREKVPVGETPGTYTADDLVKIRRERNWTTYDLGQYLGCNQSTISRMENNALPIRPAFRKLLDGLQPISAGEVAA